MAVNLIVAAATLLMAGFVVVWIGWPSWRPWLEAPKFPPARWDFVPNDEPRLVPNPCDSSTTTGKRLTAIRSTKGHST
jgi:hypothetical protein